MLNEKWLAQDRFYIRRNMTAERYVVRDVMLGCEWTFTGSDGYRRARTKLLQLRQSVEGLRTLEARTSAL